jgi:hypothetical protein
MLTSQNDADKERGIKRRDCYQKQSLGLAANLLNHFSVVTNVVKLIRPLKKSVLGGNSTSKM